MEEGQNEGNCKRGDDEEGGKSKRGSAALRRRRGRARLGSRSVRVLLDRGLRARAGARVSQTSEGSSSKREGRTSVVGSLTSSPCTTSVFSGGGATPSSLYTGGTSSCASVDGAASLPLATGSPVAVCSVASPATGASDATTSGAAVDEPRSVLFVSCALTNASLNRLASAGGRAGGPVSLERRARSPEEEGGRRTHSPSWQSGWRGSRPRARRQRRRPRRCRPTTGPSRCWARGPSRA